MFFETVRTNLLQEANASPNLLSDLAGLENYVAESYNNRSFVELLQNADDAKATKFKIVKKHNLLFVANNGRVFNQDDLESLCRSAASNKTRGETIGYRGIGFKSVVGFAKEIHLISGNLQLTFSKERTQNDIKQANKVPLIRIPHNLREDDKQLITPIVEVLKSEEFTTIFIFTGIVADKIELEFNSFKYNSLIFLRNVIETEFSTSENIITKIKKTKISVSEFHISFQINNDTSNWLISNHKESAIAFFEKENIVKLPETESLVHAFLPTEDYNGLGVLINGNFSTDPSRRHLIYDNSTEDAIKLCGKHIIKLIENNLQQNSKNSFNIIHSLIPYSDPRLLQFKNKSFIKLLFENIKSDNPKLLENIKLCPSWLNYKDFSVLANVGTFHILDSSYYEIDNFNSLAKYLGATEINFNEISESINKSEISILGCVQLTQHIFKSILSFNKMNEFDFIDLKIIHCNKQRKSLNELKINSQLIDKSFISLLLENGLTEFDIKQVLTKFLSKNKIEKQYFIKTDNEIIENATNSKSVSNWFNSVKVTAQGNGIKTSIKRWRNAEQQTLHILNFNGFQLDDVSKQNIGYDLEGLDPNGNQIQIEVKSVTLPGQKFKLTNNEIAVAQEKQNSFYVAVVRQTENAFEIALISDPVNNLTLNRQCVQWIWECTDYEYKPMIFEI